MAMDITVQSNPMAHSKQTVFSAPFEKEEKKDVFFIATKTFLLSIFITMSDTKSKSQQRISIYFWGL